MRLVLSGMSTAASIEFTGMKFNAALDYYQLQNDVNYTKYPFATEGHPERNRLLAYRFRAYEYFCTAYRLLCSGCKYQTSSETRQN